MQTSLRIREASPSELFADRLEREASLLPAASGRLADDYRSQAKMLREMASCRVSG